MLKIYNITKSLVTTNVLLTLLIFFFIFGAVVMPGNPVFENINETAFLKWLNKAPAPSVWWLWASVISLVLLTINTIVCSIESFIIKREKKGFFLKISPQIIHIGFCFGLLAHLVSGISSYKQYMYLQKHYTYNIDSEISITLEDVSFKSQGRVMTEYEASIRYKTTDGQTGSAVISPNHPCMINGVGVYLTKISMYPYPNALIQVSYDPGAIWALIGGVLIIIGTITILFLKNKSE